MMYVHRKDYLLFMSPHAENKVSMIATCFIAFNDEIFVIFKKLKHLSNPSCHSLNLSFLKEDIYRSIK